jgi:hypothetical protein
MGSVTKVESGQGDGKGDQDLARDIWRLGERHGIARR